VDLLRALRHGWLQFREVRRWRDRQAPRCRLGGDPRRVPFGPELHLGTARTQAVLARRGRRHSEDIRRPLGITHTYDPDALRQVADFFEEEDPGRDPGIRSKGTSCKLDDCNEFLLLDEAPTQRLVCRARTEQDAVRNDDGRTTAGLKQTQKEARKSSSVFLVFTSLTSAFDVDS
jgi:hypothetical protein